MRPCSFLPLKGLCGLLRGQTTQELTSNSLPTDPAHVLFQDRRFLGSLSHPAIFTCLFAQCDGPWRVPTAAPKLEQEAGMHRGVGGLLGRDGICLGPCRRELVSGGALGKGVHRREMFGELSSQVSRARRDYAGFQ
ncbi:unnamed protein product [Rangifer tarandus platyrhynchus]|uniref:Uncharacterized protein n=1 Tax=Rangifer tarandus platyrhynchus TaxID=3082113 RepID=A0AC59YW93_RANTA